MVLDDIVWHWIGGCWMVWMVLLVDLTLASSYFNGVLVLDDLTL